jgi:hypothetical protein
VDAQIAAMHAMHQRMMAAKTPADRKALMAEHERMMREGMTTMDGMSDEGSAGGACDMGERDHRMGKRMEMMQAMIQLIMDRMSEHTQK